LEKTTVSNVSLETLRSYDILSQYEAAMLVAETTDTKSENFLPAIKQIDRAINAGTLPTRQAADCEIERGNKDKAKVLRLKKTFLPAQTLVDEKQTMIRMRDLLKWMHASDEPEEVDVVDVKSGDGDTAEETYMAKSQRDIAKFNAAQAQAEAEIAKYNADIARANAAEAKSKEEEAKANAQEAKAREGEAQAKAEEAKAIAAIKPIDKRRENSLLCFIGGLATKLNYLPFNHHSVGKAKRDLVSELDEGTIRGILRKADEVLYAKED